MVERRLAKAKVAGSSPVIRSIKNKAPQKWCFVFYYVDFGSDEPAQTKGLQRASMRQHTWIFDAIGIKCLEPRNLSEITNGQTFTNKLTKPLDNSLILWYNSSVK